jgi:hypothetical protein
MQSKIERLNGKLSAKLDSNFEQLKLMIIGLQAQAQQAFSPPSARAVSTASPFLSRSSAPAAAKAERAKLVRLPCMLTGR